MRVALSCKHVLALVWLDVIFHDFRVRLFRVLRDRLFRVLRDPSWIVLRSADAIGSCPSSYFISKLCFFVFCCRCVVFPCFSRLISVSFRDPVGHRYGGLII